MNPSLIKLLLPATLAVAFATSAGAAEAVKTTPAASRAAVQQSMKVKRVRADVKPQQTAAENEARSQGGHNRINNDAGVPPSGVPTETVNV